MAIADTAFEATLRADTASANLSQQITQLYSIVDAIIARTVTKPVWNGPVINTSTIDTSGAPTFTESFVSPGTPPTASDYVAAMQAAFLSVNGQAPSELAAELDTWLVKYAPEYITAMAALDATLAQGVLDGDPLGEDVQTALYTKAQNQIDAAAKAAYETAIRAVRGAGWEVVQPMQEAVLYRFAQSTADAEIAAAIESYLKTYEIRVNHKQLCIKVQADIRNATQAAMTNMAQVLAGLKKFALEYGSEVGRLGVLDYQAQLEGFKTILETNIKTFESYVEKNKAQLLSYQTRLETEIKNASLLLDKYKVQIESSSIDYKGDLETRLEKYKGDVTGLNTLSSAVSGATHALGQYASSCASVMNAIVSSTEQI